MKFLLFPLNRKGKRKPAGDGQAAEETIRLNEELQELINRAEKQAENIIRQAHEEADSIRRQAREEGYQAGLKEGKALATGKAMRKP